MDINIHINEDGYIDKVTPFKFSENRLPHEALFEFNNGILCKSMVRNLSTGEIVERFDKSDLISKFNSEFSAQQKSFLIDKIFYTKGVYYLDFSYDKNATYFEDNGILSHSQCQITDVIQAKKHNYNYSFKFRSLFSSKSNSYHYISSSILFWFDVASGNIFNFAKGNDTKLVYPQIAIVEMDEQVKEIMPVAIIEPERKINKDIIFRNVQVMPTFPGGEDSLSAFVKRNLNYRLLELNNCDGLVAVNFVVNEEGVISSFQVDKNRNLGGRCDEEVVRMIQSMPLWIPGSQDGQNVKVAYRLTIYANGNQ